MGAFISVFYKDWLFLYLPKKIFMSNIRLHDKSFRPFIEYDRIEAAIDSVAGKINEDYKDSEDVPVLLCVPSTDPP